MKKGHKMKEKGFGTFLGGAFFVRPSSCLKNSKHRNDLIFLAKTLKNANGEDIEIFDFSCKENNGKQGKVR